MSETLAPRTLPEAGVELETPGAPGRPLVATPPPRRRSVPPTTRLRHFALQAAPPLVVFVLALVVWQLISTVFFGKNATRPDDFFAPKNYLLPTPLDVWNAFWLRRDSLFQSLQVTFWAAITGFLLAAVIGALIAMLLAQAKWIERSLYPYAIILQTIPVVAIAPIIVIWLGFGFNAVVTIAFIIALFPIISNTTVGLISTDHNMLNLFAMYNASRWQQLSKLRLPSALPYFLAGLRISSGLSVIGAIVGEFIAGLGGGEGGMGYLIRVAQGKNQMDYLFAAALASSALGIAIFLAVSWLSNWTLRNWHESAVRIEN